jgi:hypothetical protein
MAAGLGFKTFTTGEVLTAADTNGYLMQGVLVFADAAARDAAITSPAEGQFAYTKDVNGLWYYDGAAWVASGATGDIEGVTAGTGISGGGTSGTVTITNSMATAIDAKGDLIGGTGADAFDRLAVGADGTQLVADSTEATGLKWATPTSSTLPTFSAYKNASTQTFSVSTYTKITFDVENWDDPGCFTSSTFTPTSAGYYLISSAVYHQQVGNGDFTLLVYKNGSNWQRLYINNPTSAGVARMDTGATLVYCNGTTDYIEIYARGDSGGNVSVIEGATLSYFSAIGIRA